MKRLLFFAGILAAAASMAMPPRKVISAVRVEKGPVVDGDLSDEVWKKAEVKADYEDALSKPMPPSSERTEMRLLTDGDWLYVGISVTSIRELPPMTNETWKGEWTPMKKLPFNWLHEIFLDPMRTRSHHYQYCVRADQRCMAQYAGDWTAAKKDVKIATRRGKKEWTLEFAFPAKGQLKPGDTWGFDHWRRDEVCHSGWYVFSGASNTPQLFAPLLIGSYAEWFGIAFDRIQARIDGYRKTFKGGFTAERLDRQQTALSELRADFARGARPTVGVFLAVDDLNAALDRIDDAQLLVDFGFASETLVRNVDFNEWAWRPIDTHTANEMMQATKNEEPELPHEVIGPMVRIPVFPGEKYASPFPVGRRDQEDGIVPPCLFYKGYKKSHTLFFQHGPFGGFMRPDRRYRYSFWWKGKGRAIAYVELQAVDKKTSKQEAVHDPKRILADVELPAEWTEVKGVFEFPPPPEGKVWQDRQGFTIHTLPGTDMWLDEIKIWEQD